MNNINYEVIINDISLVDDVKLYRLKVELTNGIVNKTAYTEISIPASHPFTISETQIIKLWYETPSTPKNISGSITL